MKDSFGRLLSRTNLDWHDVSANHSRPVIRLHFEAVRHAQRISSMLSGLSTPTASKNVKYQIPTSHEVPLRFEA